jgi:hypothetical protein
LRLRVSWRRRVSRFAHLYLWTSFRARTADADGGRVVVVVNPTRWRRTTVRPAARRRPAGHVSFITVLGKRETEDRPTQPRERMFR